MRGEWAACQTRFEGCIARGHGCVEEHRADAVWLHKLEQVVFRRSIFEYTERAHFCVRSGSFDRSDFGLLDRLP
eukprot:2353996-Pyramimonas_sp.AAC.1